MDTTPTIHDSHTRESLLHLLQKFNQDTAAAVHTLDGIVSAVDRVQTVCSSVIEQTTDMRITHRNARLVRRKLRDIDKWKTSAQKVDAILQSKQYKQLDPAISVLLHAEAFLDDPDCPLPLHQQRSLATDITAAKAHASTWYLQQWSKYCQSMSTLNAARIEQAALVPETAIHICPSTHQILMSDGSNGWASCQGCHAADACVMLMQ